MIHNLIVPSKNSIDNSLLITMPKVYQLNYENSLEIEKELFNSNELKNTGTNGK
jgi:hypothetical protein